MRREAIVIIVLGLVAFVCGCIEMKEEFFINPDGSGKVRIENLFQAMDLGGGDPQAAMKKAVRSILEKSSGVEAWSDVSFQSNPDGKILFKGTAYFKDVSKLKIESAAGLSVLLTKDAAGNLVVEVKSEEKGGAKKTPGALTEEEIQKKITDEKAKYQQNRPIGLQLFGGFDHR